MNPILRNLLLFGVQKTIPYTNLVTNGDFSDGTTGYDTLGFATHSVTDSVLSIVANGATPLGLDSQITTTAIQANHIYYTRIKYKVTNADCLEMKIYNVGTTAGNTSVVLRTTPTINTVYDEGVIMYVGASTGYFAVWFAHIYANEATANGKVMEVSQVMAIDLTAMFGAGNEPSLARCDTNMPFVATSGLCPAL